MNLEEIKRLRSLQPKTWNNIIFTSFNWNLVSINNGGTGDKFGDVHTEFVEKSLEIIDFLLEEIEKLNNSKQK